VTLSAELWPDVQPDAARRLMLAAVESFARRGFHATTTRDIASAAGMSPAALYVHFPSKAAVLFAISESGHQQTLTLIESVANRDNSPRDKMRKIVEDLVAWQARRHTVAQVIEYELQALPEKEYAVIAGLRRRIEHTIRNVVADGVEQGVFAVGDVRTAARAVLSLGVDVARWYTERNSKTPKALGRDYAELALRMLGAD
jgi:AcrR family transcriptional regulator